MRKIMLKSFIGGLVFTFTIIGVLFLAKAWNGLQSSPGDKLTSATWNQLTTKASVNYQRVILTDGDWSNATYSTWTNIPGASITITTANNPVLIMGMAQYAGGVMNVGFDISIDGTLQGGGRGTWLSTVNGGGTASINYISPVLSAGSHTIRFMVKSDAALSIRKSAITPVNFSVMELKQ